MYIRICTCTRVLIQCTCIVDIIYTRTCSLLSWPFSDKLARFLLYKYLYIHVYTYMYIIVCYTCTCTPVRYEHGLVCMHGHVYNDIACTSISDLLVHIHVLMRDEKEGRKKEASKVKQTTKQRNTAHPRQSLFLRKMSTCTMYMYMAFGPHGLLIWIIPCNTYPY